MTISRRDDVFSATSVSPIENRIEPVTEILNTGSHYYVLNGFVTQFKRQIKSLKLIAISQSNRIMPMGPFTVIFIVNFVQSSADFRGF